MKRTALIIFTLILALALCACSSNSDNETLNNTSASNNNTPASEPTPRATAGNTDPANAGNQNTDDGDLPDWNGFDFGPNLEYAEEYEIMGDPGDYMNAFEAAKYTFEMARDNGYIPEYSDETQYTMVLVALEDFVGDECYVYRLDIDEPTGTLGAAFAFSYQSERIYMEGYAGEYFLIIEDGMDVASGGNGGSDPGDTGVPNWWGEFKTDEVSIGLVNYNGTSFHFTFYNLRDGQGFYDGVAAIDPGNILNAEYGEISFWLSEDFEAISIFVSTGSEWEHLAGYYERVD